MMATKKKSAPKTKTKAKAKAKSRAHSPTPKAKLKVGPASKFPGPVSSESLSEQRFRELLEAAPDGILEVDQQGHIQLANAAVERMFGYMREELLDQPVDLLVPQTVRPQHGSHRAEYWAHPGTR